MEETAHALGSARTLWELVGRRAALTPHRPVLLQGERVLTFGELRDRAERTAAGLYAKGVGPGTVVAWQLPTRIETVLLTVALARLGAVQSPVIPFYRDREVGFALRESRAAYFAVPGEWRGFDFTAMARRAGARGVFEAYASLPDGDPSVLPAPPASGTAPPPTPRACCTPTVR
jgi:non-ribosomal peptide synthetase component E (peptide arylation enzyme)